MLNKMDVVEPPKSAPQYMLVSRMMADTGSITKVSGNSRDTPLGAPRPGRTPTRMPSRTPPAMSARWNMEKAILNPSIRLLKFSKAELLCRMRACLPDGRQWIPSEASSGPLSKGT